MKNAVVTVTIKVENAEEWISSLEYFKECIEFGIGKGLEIDFGYPNYPYEIEVNEVKLTEESIRKKEEVQIDKTRSN